MTAHHYWHDADRGPIQSASDRGRLHAEGTLTSAELSLGLPGVKKSIASISLIAEKRPGTSASLAYSLDGGAWVNGGESITLPPKATATQVRYRVTLTGKPAATPVLRQVRIVYDVAPVDDGEWRRQREWQRD